ncbi:hypothetical protein MycrhDRAFT_1565 [Mycolicibacterium rhodesiae JS60]|nr:hypothetical protein MycrhDRAFT_1565 [Mycolicibacterium rhodesiae JS60]
MRAVLAHSFGAVFVLHGMLRADIAAQVGALVVYDPPLMLDPAEARHQVATAGALVGAGEYERGVTEAVKLMLSLDEPELNQLRRNARSWATTVSMAPALMVQAATMADLGRLVAPFKDVDHPTLLVHGQFSRDVFAESIDALAHVMPNTCRLELQGQGHGGLSGSPDVLASAIGTFLAGLQP